jgi:hypothetical protein
MLENREKIAMVQAKKFWPLSLRQTTKKQGISSRALLQVSRKGIMP